MSDTTWTAIVAALGAASLTVGGSFWLAWCVERWRAKATSAAAVVSAVNNVLTLSFEVTLRTQQWVTQVDHYSSRWTRLDILFGLEARPCWDRLIEPMIAAQKNLNAALSGLWLQGGVELITQANAVALASAEVMSGLLESGPWQAKDLEITLLLQPMMDHRRNLAIAARQVLSEDAADLLAAAPAD